MLSGTACQADVLMVLSGFMTYLRTLESWLLQRGLQALTDALARLIFRGQSQSLRTMCSCGPGVQLPKPGSLPHSYYRYSTVGGKHQLVGRNSEESLNDAERIGN